VSNDQPAGALDRRALIKKGLVAGGIVATAPVITTFNSAAFASSVPGFHSFQYTINPNTDVVLSATPDTTNCPPANPNYVGGNVGLATVTTSPLAGDAYQFQLTGAYASCEWVDATAFRGSQCLGPASFTGIGTNTLTFDAASFSGGSGVFTVRLLAQC